LASNRAQRGVLVVYRRCHEPIPIELLYADNREPNTVLREVEREDEAERSYGVPYPIST
jgi:hypothetical protein